MNALRDVTTRSCDTCGYEIDFDTTAAADRFLASSHWIETLKGFRRPVCVEGVAKAAKMGQVFKPMVRKAPSLASFGEVEN